MSTKSPSRTRSNRAQISAFASRTQPCETGRPIRVFLVGAVEIDVALERVVPRPAIDAVLEPVEGEDAREDEIAVAILAAPHLARSARATTNTVPAHAPSPIRAWMRCQPGGVLKEFSSPPMPFRAVETGHAATAVSVLDARSRSAAPHRPRANGRAARPARRGGSSAARASANARADMRRGAGSRGALCHNGPPHCHPFFARSAREARAGETPPALKIALLPVAAAVIGPAPVAVIAVIAARKAARNSSCSGAARSTGTAPGSRVVAPVAVRAIAPAAVIADGLHACALWLFTLIDLGKRRRLRRSGAKREARHDRRGGKHE